MVFRGIGLPELIILLVIVVAIFGVGRLAQLGGALGQSIRDFRSAVRDKPAEIGQPEDEATPKP